MGVYVSRDQDSPKNASSNLMFSIDNGPAVNFTVTNPVNLTNALDEPQLLLQTMQFPSGEHRFHLEFLPPAQVNQTIIKLHSIVVQNSESTLERNLTAFPANETVLVSAAPPSLVPTEISHISALSRHAEISLIGIIIGSLVGAFAAVGIIFLILRILFGRRRLASSKVSSRVAIRLSPRSQSFLDEQVWPVTDKRSSITKAHLLE